MKGSSCRQRKVSCEHCGYTIRITRSWISVGLPTCPCGQAMRPDSPADLAYCGLVGPDDMPAAMWTVICRENGWEDAIQRRGGAARAYERKMLEAGGILNRKTGAAHCAYPGCGRWVADGADRCTAGHAQYEDAPALECAPF